LAYENLDRFYKQRNEEETINLLCKPININEMFWIDSDLEASPRKQNTWFNFYFNPHVNLFEIFVVYRKISLHALDLQLMLILRNLLAMQQSKNVLIYFGMINYQLNKKNHQRRFLK